MLNPIHNRQHGMEPHNGEQESRKAAGVNVAQLPLKMKADSQTRARLCCTSCLSVLVESANKLDCPGCGKKYELIDGIPCLAQNRQYYYGEIPQKPMQELVEACRTQPWREALEGTLRVAPYPSGLLLYAVGGNRAGWWPLLNLRRDSRVLDLGCGWGAISFALARRAGLVVGCDLAVERLRFLQQRAVQEGARNVQLVWGGDGKRLPFRDNEFDLVVLNGVLEWVPQSVEGSPDTIQLEFLKEVARVLSKHGQLVLAIENRWSWLYWMGRPEEHSRIRYVSLLPRGLANIYARLRTGKPYRTHTHSYWAYKRMLRTAGFQSSQIVVPLRDYRSFEAIVDPEREQTVADFFESLGRARAGRIGNTLRGRAARLLSPSFCCIAERDGTGDSFLKLLAAEVTRQVSGTQAPDVTWQRYRVTPPEVAVVTLEWDSGRKRVIVKLPLAPTARERCTHERDTLQALRGLFPRKAGALPEIPESLGLGEFQGQPYFIETCMPGYAATRFLGRSKDFERVLKLSSEFIARFGRATQERTTITEHNWALVMTPGTRAGITRIRHTLSVSAELFETYLKKCLTGQTWPTVWGHGDFWCGNVMTDEDGKKVTGVVDWDRSLSKDLAGVDLLGGFIYGRKVFEKRRVPDLIGSAITTGKLHPVEEILLANYAKSLGFELGLRQKIALLLLYWVRYVGLREGHLANPATWKPEWLRENVSPAEQWLKPLLASQ